MHHFINTAVNACIIEHQNVILYLERGEAVISNIEIWERFINERDEFFRSDNPDLIQAIEIVLGLINDGGVSLTFHSKEKEAKNTDKMAEEQIENAPKTKKRKFKVPYARKQTSYVQIPVGKESLSAVKMEIIMEQKSTVSDSSDLEIQEVFC